MVAQVNVHEAKTHLSRLLERAHAGEEIVLAKAGKPYARLVPLEPLKPLDQLKPRELGFLKGHVDREALLAPLFTEKELDEFENEPLLPPVERRLAEA